MNGVRCSAGQLLLQYIKCVFFTADGFSFHSGVSVRVLRPMFVPGCGGLHEYVNPVSFSHFLPAVAPPPTPPLCFSSIISPLNQPHRLVCFLCFLLICFLLFFCILPLLFLPFSSSFPPPFPPFFFFIPPSLPSFAVPPGSPPCLDGPMGALWFVCWKA